MSSPVTPLIEKDGQYPLGGAAVTMPGQVVELDSEELSKYIDLRNTRAAAATVWAVVAASFMVTQLVFLGTHFRDPNAPVDQVLTVLSWAIVFFCMSTFAATLPLILHLGTMHGLSGDILRAYVLENRLSTCRRIYGVLAALCFIGQLLLFAWFRESTGVASFVTGLFLLLSMLLVLIIRSD